MQTSRVAVVVVGVLLAVALGGCKSVAPGADAALLRAEQAVYAALETTNALVAIEREHEAELARLEPQAHAVAERIRTEFPPAYARAVAAIDAYRSARTEDAAVRMQAYIAALKELALLADGLLAKWGRGR